VPSIIILPVVIVGGYDGYVILTEGGLVSFLENTCDGRVVISLFWPADVPANVEPINSAIIITTNTETLCFIFYSLNPIYDTSVAHCSILLLYQLVVLPIRCMFHSAETNSTWICVYLPVCIYHVSLLVASCSGGI
jgi:hypothetical protein